MNPTLSPRRTSAENAEYREHLDRHIRNMKRAIKREGRTDLKADLADLKQERRKLENQR